MVKNLGQELNKIVVEHDKLKQYASMLNSYLKNGKLGGITDTNKSLYSRGVELSLKFYFAKTCMRILSILSAHKEIDVLDACQSLVERNLRFLEILLEALDTKGLDDTNIKMILAKYYQYMTKEYKLIEDNIGENVLSQIGYSRYLNVTYGIRITVFTDLKYHTSLRDKSNVLSAFNNSDYEDFCLQCASEYRYHIDSLVNYTDLNAAVKKLNNKWERSISKQISNEYKAKERVERQKQKEEKNAKKLQEKLRMDYFNKREAELTKDVRLQLAVGSYGSYVESAILSNNSSLIFHPDDWEKFATELDKLCGEDEGIIFEFVVIGQYFKTTGECRCYLRNRVEGELKDASNVSRRTLKISEAKVIRIDTVQEWYPDGRPVVWSYEQDDEYILHRELGLATLVKVCGWRNRRYILRKKAKNYDYSKGMNMNFYGKINYV